MDDYPESAMIALLPVNSDWAKIKLPHMTLVSAGEIGVHRKPSDFNAMAKDACSIAMMTGPFSVKVIGIETFGTEEKVDVFELENTTLLRSMRHFVEKWNESEHQEFRPHCTIGPAGTFVSDTPMYLTFDRICVSWGKDVLPFWLKSHSG